MKTTKLGNIFAILLVLFSVSCSVPRDISGCYKNLSETIVLTADSLFYYVRGIPFDEGLYSIDGGKVLFQSKNGDPHVVPFEVDTVNNHSNFSTFSVRIIDKDNEDKDTYHNIGKLQAYEPCRDVFDGIIDWPIVNGKEPELIFPSDMSNFWFIFKPIYTEIKSIQYELTKVVLSRQEVGPFVFPSVMVLTPKYQCSIPVGHTIRITFRVNEDDFKTSVLYGKKFRIKGDKFIVTERNGEKTKLKKAK